MSKYIYYLYKDRINYYHYERFPIIYENKEYIYFKENAKDMLSYVQREYVEEYFTFPEKHFKAYYLNPINDNDLEQLRNCTKNEDIIHKLRNLYTCLNTAEKNVIDYKNKINGYMEALKHDGCDIEKIKSMIK